LDHRPNRSRWRTRARVMWFCRVSTPAAPSPRPPCCGRPRPSRRCLVAWQADPGPAVVEARQESRQDAPEGTGDRASHREARPGMSRILQCAWSGCGDYRGDLTLASPAGFGPRCRRPPYRQQTSVRLPLQLGWRDKKPRLRGTRMGIAAGGMMRGH
jgi:hypothetical protein